ncbi:LAFE_0B12464g1_1 [Lachancea fermentati]|uniref:LAFE_0B12464g1_1 n=1 Tax=Lachancea fermentati TaxID=4955 RepID=A0A1G4M8Q9_LACFM|nr:LAFE_0B12464g1_1 [Lachancea fermentati]
MNNADTTSFQSVLSGVRKLQDKNASISYPSNASNSAESKGKREIQTGNVINSFNQQKDHLNRQLSPEVPRGKRRIDSLGSGKTILVSSSQKGNPLLNCLTNTNWRYVSSSGGTKIYYDYNVKGRNVVFLSLKYHKLHPEYIAKKMQPLIKKGNNILICVVDIERSEDILKDLNKDCMFNDFVMLLAFNFEQAAKYLMFMNK